MKAAFGLTVPHVRRSLVFDVTWGLHVADRAFGNQSRLGHESEAVYSLAADECSVTI